VIALVVLFFFARVKASLEAKFKYLFVVCMMYLIFVETGDVGQYLVR